MFVILSILIGYKHIFKNFVIGSFMLYQSFIKRHIFIKNRKKKLMILFNNVKII